MTANINKSVFTASTRFCPPALIKNRRTHMIYVYIKYVGAYEHVLSERVVIVFRYSYKKSELVKIMLRHDDFKENTHNSLKECINSITHIQGATVKSVHIQRENIAHGKAASLY